MHFVLDVSHIVCHIVLISTGLIQTKEKEMTKERRAELLQEVVRIQNDPKNWDRDIVSFTGFFTEEEEFLKHIENNK